MTASEITVNGVVHVEELSSGRASPILAPFNVATKNILPRPALSSISAVVALVVTASKRSLLNLVSEWTAA